MRKRLILLLLLPVCLIASFVAATVMLLAIVCNPAQAWVMAIAHDQLANAAVLGNPDETINSRANRARAEGRRWGCILCRFLDGIEQDHCRRSAGT